MILIGFSLLDIKTGIFNTPFFMAHAGQAMRACVDLGQDRNTTVGRHPADFQLCQVGTFDDQTGMFSIGTPVPLGTVASFLPPPAAAPLFDADAFNQVERGISDRLAGRADTSTRPNGRHPDLPAAGPIGGEGV